MDDPRFFTPRETEVMMGLARKLHAGEIQLPEEIVRVNKLIKEKTRLAETFFIKLGAVDMMLAHEITELRFEKDALYGRWTREAAAGLI